MGGLHAPEWSREGRLSLCCQDGLLYQSCSRIRYCSDRRIQTRDASGNGPMQEIQGGCIRVTAVPILSSTKDRREIDSPE